jgi:hypothetical protein
LITHQELLSGNSIFKLPAIFLQPANGASDCLLDIVQHWYTVTVCEISQVHPGTIVVID